MRIMATVEKRVLFTLIIVIALLSSAWGNVLAASFCPHFAQNHVRSFKHSAQQPVSTEAASHAGTCGMNMPDMQMESMDNSQGDPDAPVAQTDAANDSNTDADALDHPGEPCPHCLMHSQPTSGTATAVAVDPSKRLVEANAPADFAMASPSALIPITPLEHGPPGNSFPRHILINVFRI